MKLCEVEFCHSVIDLHSRCWCPTDAECKKWDINRCDLCLCCRGVQALFQVPEVAKRMWLSLHDMAGVDRYRFKLVVNRPNECRKDTEWDLEVDEDVDGAEGYGLDDMDVDFLGEHPTTKKHFAKTRAVWLECWYAT